MKRPVYLIYFALAALQLAVASSSVVEAVKVDEEPNSDSLPWAPERYPSSPNEVACHSGASNRFCDPDSMLSQADRQLLSKSLKDSPTRRILLPPKCNGPQQRETSSEEVQFGVALLRKVRY